MNPLVRRCLGSALGIMLLIMVQACVVGGAGYEGGGVEAAYGVDFYEPYGYDYGGWGPGYRVGPPRGGEGRDHGRTGGPAPAFHPAAPSRPMPSIPTGSRRH